MPNNIKSSYEYIIEEKKICAMKFNQWVLLRTVQEMFRLYIKNLCGTWQAKILLTKP